MSNNKLDKVIPVDNPLEPEKGGYLKAYIDNFDYGDIHHDPTTRRANFDSWTLDPLPYNMGLKDEILKLNLETGKAVNLLSNDLGDPDLTDIRVISFNTAQKLGVLDKDGEAKAIRTMSRALALANLPQFPDKSLAEEMLSEGDTALPISNKVLESSTSTGRWANYSFSSYFQSSLANGNLISLALVSDRDFINAIDNAGKILSPKLSFDDARYEPQFKKVEQLFNHFSIKLRFGNFGDFDSAQELFSLGKDKSDLGFRDELETADKPWAYYRRSPFADLTPYKASTSYDLKEYGAPYSLLFPKPILFKSENDYLKAGAHAITNHIINCALSGELPDLKLNKKLFSAPDYLYSFAKQDVKFERESKALLARDIAGTMFAAQFGVPLTQNDVNRVHNYYFVGGIKDWNKAEFEQIISSATKVANFARNLDLSKDLNLNLSLMYKELWQDWKKSHEQHLSPINKDLWQDWKKSHEQHAMQMATPSIPQICKQYNVEVTRDNVIKALNNLTSQKFNEVAQSKEPIKAALSQEQPINQALMTKSISVPTDKSKAPKTKGAER